MRSKRSIALAGCLLLASCSVDHPTQNTLPEIGAASLARKASVACRPAELRSVEKGKIHKNDCLFGTGQREDLFRVDPAELGLPDRSGASMLTFSAEAEFDGIVGVSRWDETTFGDPVFGSRRFAAGAPNGFALIGSSAEYKLYVGGGDASQEGRYEITTTVQPSASVCQTGILAFLQGTVSFSSDISEAHSCAGTIVAGPNAGGPLHYHYWYAKVVEGQEVRVRADGIALHAPAAALAVLVFSNDPANPLAFEELDLGDGVGDTDRELVFTAPFTGYYYVEVSTIPGMPTPYTLHFSGT